MSFQSEKQPFTKVRLSVIGPEEEGQRIDNYLMRVLKGVPKGHVYKILRKGEVRVNKGRIKPTYKLKSGDNVRIPPVRIAERANEPRHDDGKLGQIEDWVLFEDKGLIVLDKPSGWAVHGGSGLSYGVIEGLRMRRPDAPYLELVHRLDRDTSGCLIIAKKRSVLRSLHELLRTGKIHKEYLALVMGRWARDSKVDVPLRKFLLQGGERMVRVQDDGKSARSNFSAVQDLPGAGLMRVILDTGRTHQIRVHAQHCGHPIAGDDKYGDRDFNRQMKSLGLRRLFLHAHRIAFELPLSGIKVDVTSALPSDLSGVLEKLLEKND